MKYEKCLTHTFRSCAPLAIRSVSEQHLFLTSLGSRFLNMRYSIVPEARQHVAWGARPCHYPHLWEVRMETSSIPSPAGTSALCRVREHPVSIAAQGSPPSRHPRHCRGCRLGGEPWVAIETGCSRTRQRADVPAGLGIEDVSIRASQRCG